MEDIYYRLECIFNKIHILIIRQKVTLHWFSEAYCLMVWFALTIWMTRPEWASRMGSRNWTHNFQESCSWTDAWFPLTPYFPLSAPALHSPDGCCAKLYSFRRAEVRGGDKLGWLKKPKSQDVFYGREPMPICGGPAVVAICLHLPEIERNVGLRVLNWGSPRQTGKSWSFYVLPPRWISKLSRIIYLCHVPGISKIQD